MIKINQIKLMLAFILFILPALSFAAEIDLPKTGQSTCYDGSGNVIDCTNTGQDGDIQAGVEWPEPRFTDNGDGTVTDNLTGLMWLKDGNCFGTRNWQGALDVVADFNSNSDNYSCSDYTATYTDWVLPNIIEIESLMILDALDIAAWLNTQEFTNLQSNYYWSATTYAPVVADAWRIFMYNGYLDNAVGKSVVYHYVWPVRAGQAGPAKTWQTGQTISYTTDDDGYLQRGASWPSPRFEDNGDGTVTDNLTGLIWLKNTNCSGTMNWDNALTYCNNLVSGSCGLSDGSVAGDWRLPNRKELLSLADYGNYDPAFPSGHPFTGLESDYWSATTSSQYNYNAWYFNMLFGSVYMAGKSQNSWVWPVRSSRTCKGDFEPDGDVDGLDLNVFSAGYAAGSLMADLDNSEVVDAGDVAIFAAEFGRTDC